MTNKLEYGYECVDNKHIWFIKGAEGGIHVWAKRYPDDIAERLGERYFGGIECHSKEPTYEGQTCSYDDCWLLNGPCFHDGSSLQFSEQIEPYLPRNNESMNPENQLIHSILHDRYTSWFEGDT
jgi:hypothetical protein